MSDFNDLLEALSDDEFEEQPADLETFLYDKEFLKLPKLSKIQEEIIERGSQIFKMETLIKLHGYEKGMDLWKNETTMYLLLMLGKGSGKDFVSRILCCYVIHKLLCLRDPAIYFGKPSGDQIDIVNMAINARQAINVFFNALVKDIKRAPWFEGKFHDRMNDITFDKNIVLHSLHSSHKAAEGLNIIVAVLDEIDGFEVEGQADGIYDALSGTVTSRFPDAGKVICLSFPRTKDGFMMRVYNDAVVNPVIKSYEHTYKLNEALEDGSPGNEFTVHWTEDHVEGYKYDNFFALKAPTFRVNPTRGINDYKMAFYKDFQKNTQDTLMRVCANPPDHDETNFFKNHDKLERLFSGDNGWNGSLQVTGDDTKEYYIHVDLSKVHDRTVVALGHVEKWQSESAGTSMGKAKPFILVDLFRVWEPTRNDPVDHGQVRDFIVDLSRKFNIRKVTFDRWGSYEMIEYLEDNGITAEKNSLAREEYQEFAIVVGEERLLAPQDERLMKELKALIINANNGKVDHPKGKDSHNDISEAICGVIVNCVENSIENNEVEIVTLNTYGEEDLPKRRNSAILNRDRDSEEPMPQELQNFMDWTVL